MSREHQLLVLAATICCVCGRGPLRAQVPATPPLAHFTFNGHAACEPPGAGEWELRNTEFKDHALYLNGIYEFGPQGPQGFHALCRTPGLSFAAFTVTLRFKADTFENGDNAFKQNLLTAGKRRWFTLQRSDSGRLQVGLNNLKHLREIEGVSLEAGKWIVLTCCVDVTHKRVAVYVDGKPAGGFELPADFQLAVVGTPAEATDKVWLFANYGNANVYHGLVDELIIHNRALSAEEVQQEFARLPTPATAADALKASAPSAPAAAEFLSPPERELLDLVNQERAKYRLPALKASRQLSQAARGHAANMARLRTLNHTLGGKTFDQRISDTGYRFSAAGENIFMGGGAAQAMYFWMRSAGHQRNLLSPTYTEIGLGAATHAAPQQYWTQVFATPLPQAPGAKPAAGR